MNAKNSKQGFKFFWIYLFLGSFSAISSFANCLKAITLNQDNVYFLLNIYTALMCILFVIATVMFLLSTLFAWKYIYSILHSHDVLIFVRNRTNSTYNWCLLYRGFLRYSYSGYISWFNFACFFVFQKKKKIASFYFPNYPKER